MRKLRTIAALAATLMLVGGVPAGASGNHDRGDGDRHHRERPGVERYQVSLDSVPHPGDDGGSDTEGRAWISRRGNHIKVVMQVRDAAPGLPHAQHIHGIGMTGMCPTADKADDLVDDGLISTLEGAPDYGGIQASLTTRGDTSPDSGLAVDRFPVANDRGYYTYVRTFEVPKEVARELDRYHVVVHGMDINHNGAYDFDAGVSSLTDELPLEATIPAACGEIEMVNRHH